MIVKLTCCSFIFLFFCLSPSPVYSGIKPDITVAKDGSGDYRSIQEAIDRIPQANSERMIIFVKNGTYREKIFMDKYCISLIGEDPEMTRIELPILRENWRKDHSDDWGAAPLNIRASDFVMKNITVYNTYGDRYNDHGHQFAVRLMQGTRIIFENCRFIAGGGDTVSLWDKEKGMYYHSNCYFEGYVDFVCPRGWCFIRDSQFFQRGRTATLWLDGNLKESKKLVIRNSQFDGVEEFQLGRRHYDAQFFLIDCNFTKHMADQPIYRVTYPDNPSRNAPNVWGDRYYYYNCHRQGGDYAWHRDNLNQAKGNPEPVEITPAWTFENKWDPESKQSPEIKNVTIKADTVELHYNETMTVKGQPELRLESGETGQYKKGSGSHILQFVFNGPVSEADRPDRLQGENTRVMASQASFYLRLVSIESPDND